MASGARLKVLVAVVLAGLLAVLVGALAVAGTSDGPDDGTADPTPATPAASSPSGSPSTSPSSGSDREGERSALLAYAEEAVAVLLSYDHRTFDDDLDEAARWTTREFGTQIGETLRSVQDSVEEVEGVVDSEVVAAGLVELAEGDATVLVFVDQSSATRDSPEPRVAANRLLVRLERVEGGWAVAGLDGEGEARVVEGEPERRQALTVASDFVGEFTSVDPDPERHLEAMRPFLAPDFLAEMREQVSGTEDRTRSSGRVFAAGIARLEETTAEVLVSADARRPGGQTQSYRLVVELVREGPAAPWKVAGLRLV